MLRPVRRRPATRHRPAPIPRRHQLRPAARAFPMRLGPSRLNDLARTPRQWCLLATETRARICRRLLMRPMQVRLSHGRIRGWLHPRMAAISRIWRRRPPAPMPALVASPWSRFAPGITNAGMVDAVRTPNANAPAPATAFVEPVTRARPASASQVAVQAGSASTLRIAPPDRCASTVSVTRAARSTVTVPIAPMLAPPTCASPMVGPPRNAVPTATARPIGNA